MAEVSVFECGICYSPYNEQDKLPLSLPCGHVFCKQCLIRHASSGGISCPADKMTHHTTPDKLPCCYAILSNLPLVARKGVNCKRHPRKRVKFMCRLHNMYLCSDCLLDHTGNGHEVLGFSVTIDQMRREMQVLIENSQITINDLRDSIHMQQNYEKKITSFYEHQILKVNSAYEKAIRYLQEKKRDHADLLKKYMTEQKTALEAIKLKNTKRLDAGVAWANDVKVFSDTLDEKCYEDFAKFMYDKKTELKALVDLKKKESIEPMLYQFNGKVYLRFYKCTG